MIANLIDTSAWLEYFADSKYAAHFTEVIEDTANLVVPAIVIYEVFKIILREKDETMAINLTAHMRLGRVYEISEDISILAAKMSADFKLPMADSIIYASAYITGAKIWTMDADFKNLNGVEYFPRD